MHTLAKKACVTIRAWIETDWELVNGDIWKDAEVLGNPDPPLPSGTLPPTPLSPQETIFPEDVKINGLPHGPLLKIVHLIK